MDRLFRDRPGAEPAFILVEREGDTPCVVRNKLLSIRCGLCGRECVATPIEQVRLLSAPFHPLCHSCADRNNL